jgi:glycosyltransferase involved in cell wall biosynthesis
MPHSIDVFIDLSASRIAGPALQKLIETWVCPENLGAVGRRVTGSVAPGGLHGDAVRLPPDWIFTESESSMPAVSAALAAAGRDGVPFLLLLGPVDVSNEAVGVLRQCLERDPMFGFAVPRIGCKEGCCVVRLSRHGVGESSWLPRTILAELPESEILVEIAAACVLVNPEVSSNFGSLDAEFEAVAAAMVHYMARVRRCGFRTVLSNRAVARLDALSCDATAAPRLFDWSVEDRQLLQQRVPDLERSWLESRADSWAQFERLSTASIETPKAARPSLLMDVRNVGPIYNGTTQAVLGIVDGLKAIRPKWEVALLANPDGASFHDLARAYHGWPVHTALPDRPFTVALRPSQPWHIREMVDLHRVSLFNAYLLLDTIAWDIGYAAPPQLEGTWQFLADHADAFLFDSEFTRRRFLERFPSAGSVPGRVTHLSFDPGEYTRSGVASRSDGTEFILVIGNNLDHKDVRHTVDALVSAFPYRHIRVLGPANVASPFVTAHESGAVSDADIHGLYANAQFVVFPSFYEGFGFPILTALAYGKTVLARRSALVEEVAAQCVRRGRLVTFSGPEELVELLGRLVHGETVPEHPLGLGLGDGRPKSWADVARDALDFCESLVREPIRGRWIAREHAVRQLLSYRT